MTAFVHTHLQVRRSFLKRLGESKAAYASEQGHILDVCQGCSGMCPGLQILFWLSLHSQRISAPQMRLT